MAGLLPWLHIKNLATTALFGLFAVWQVWRERPRQNQDANRIWWGYAAAAALFVLGPATFLAYQMATHGLLLSGQSYTLAGTPYLRVVEMLLGRHVDQSQGLFWHQPLFFPGLVALGWMIRRRHPLTLFWLLLYASLIVPPAVMNRWGGAPIGRFNWGAIWLWLIPIGLWLRAERATLARYLRPAVLAALAYQTILAFRWVPDPTRLFNYEEVSLVWARDSLFPLPVRYALPHFYLVPDGWGVVRYLEYLPNLVWVAAVALLVVTGLLWNAEGRRRLRPVWIGGFVVAALLLPVEPTADTESRTDDGLHEPMVQSIESTFRRRFEAERLTPMQTADRTTRLDARASDGRARSADGRRPDGMITFGPYLTVDRVATASRRRCASGRRPMPRRRPGSMSERDAGRSPTGGSTCPPNVYRPTAATRS